MSQHPLHEAVSKGQTDLVLSLIKDGQNVNKRNLEDYAPVHIACKQGHLEILKILHKNQAKLDSRFNKKLSSLHIASKNGHLEIVKFLCNVTSLINDHPKYGTTPLHLAVKHGHFEVVEHLVAKGANVNAFSNINKSTPLHVAAELNHEKIVQHLIENGANRNLFNKNCYDPLKLAIHEGHDNIIEILLNYGAHVSVDDHIYLAIEIHSMGHKGKGLASMKRLIEHVEINRNSERILHYAVQKRNEDIVNLLVDHGADINMKNSDLNTSSKCVWRNTPAFV